MIRPELQEQEDENLALPLVNPYEDKVVKVAIFFLLMFQTLFHVSDTALNVLFHFLSLYFKMLGSLLHSDPLKSIHRSFPSTLAKARHFVGSNRDRFEKFACCQICHSVYPINECITEDGKESTKCNYVEFPNHPHVNKRKECGAILLKKVKTPTGNVSFQPNLVYCYKSLIDSLQEMLYRPNFLEMCEEWRENVSPPGVYNDIYDGKIWKDFQEVNGQPFLSLPHNFALNLNIDWFQPYSHTQHSEGVIYMTVLNLPRKQRYLQENIIK